ncbi:hypothetical protein FXV83_13935 [Bradyrhizobium hipponense]|uniref:Uncharacterized protein n=1 Tax=Bradyrhizobium hipponense TaxID=2605638 RepID=A0A5S4YNI9_9BRAD|nr:hypothetical protein FXV83_13935 [Bradyrhizobium hipponense]
MSGLVPAIHDLLCGPKNVDARDKPGHDEFVETGPSPNPLRAGPERTEFSSTSRSQRRRLGRRRRTWWRERACRRAFPCRARL